jgi:peptide/nickel transport system substrate-binding protein
MRFSRPAMKIAVLTAIGATALAACGSSGSSGSSGGSVGGTKIGAQGVFGSIPPQSGTPHPGTVKVATPPGAAPSWIMPMITAADNSVYTVLSFDYELFRPLYFTVNGVEPSINQSMSLANAPVWSNNDKTATITMKSNYKWSDGQPVTSKDVLFWYQVLKAGLKESAANWAAYTPGVGIPDQVASVTTPNATTVVFNLKASVNPSWFTENELADIQPMPEQAWAKASATGPTIDPSVPANATKIYNYLAAASKPSATWSTNPTWQTVDGPYHLTAFNVTSGAFTMAPNPKYGGPHSKDYPTLQAVPFTSDDAEVNAVKAGTVDVGYLPLNDLAELGGLKATWNDYGYPDFGWTYAAYNFKDKTGDFDNIIKQLYVRQAIAHLENEPGYVKAFFNGAGGQAFGPVPSIPKSPFTPSNALTNPYPYSITDAKNLLTAHGWKVTPGGTDVCAKAGTGSGECGAGIPAGTKLAFPVVYGTSPAVIGEQLTDLSSQAAKVGIKMTLQSSNFNFIVQNYNDPAAPKNDNKWAMEDFGGFTDSTYPTTLGVFNSTGSSDLGGYDSPQADKLIQASVTSSNPAAVQAEASYLTQQQPGLFQPNPVDAGGTAGVAVYKKILSGPPTSFENLTQAYLTPELWYFTK